MKSGRRPVRRAAAGALAVFAAIAMALVLGTLVPRAGDASVAGGTGRHEIVVLANAIHTDIALPATPEILERFAFLREAGLPLDRPDVGAILVGWGGRTFYTQTPTWSDLTASAVLASATRDRSVLHVALAPTLDPTLPRARRLVLSDAAYAALLAFIEASFTRDEAGGEIHLPDAGYSPFDAFYEAEGGFNLFLGCNTWTAAALRNAGVPTGSWTPLPQGLLWSLPAG